MDTGELTALQQRALEQEQQMTDQEYRDYNQKFHLALWRAADNAKLFQLLSSLWNGPSSTTQERDREHEALSIREHGRMLECIRQGEAEAARRVMEQHISRSMENILFSFRQAQKATGEANNE